MLRAIGAASFLIFAAAVSMPHRWPRAFNARGLSVCADASARTRPACVRHLLSFAAGIAACALVPLGGAPVLPLPTACVWPLLAISYALGSRPQEAGAMMATVGTMLAAADFYIMRVGVPGARYSPEALAMISRLPSIGTSLPAICVFSAAVSAALIAARIGVRAPCCRAAALALAELAVLTLPIDASCMLTPSTSVAVDLASRTALSCALFFLLSISSSR